jgi:hypothetical protein
MLMDFGTSGPSFAILESESALPSGYFSAWKYGPWLGFLLQWGPRNRTIVASARIHEREWPLLQALYATCTKGGLSRSLCLTCHAYVQDATNGMRVDLVYSLVDYRIQAHLPSRPSICFVTLLTNTSCYLRPASMTSFIICENSWNSGLFEFR